MKRTIALILTVLVFAVAASYAQFPIKIPKIKIPKVEETPTPAPNEPVVGPESNNPMARPGPNADSASPLTKSREMVIDDGYTFFDAEPVSEYDSAIRLNKDIGWTLKSSLRILGTYPGRSGFNVVVSKGGKEMTKIRCEGTAYQKESDSALQTAMQRKGKDLNYDNYMWAKECWDKKYVVAGTGTFDVKVYVFNGDTDEETLVRNYKIDVHRAPRVRGSTTNPQPDVAHYYISRHAEAPASFIYLAYGGISDYFYSYDRSPPGDNRVIVYFDYSPKKTTDSIGTAYARCSVNGTRLKLPGNSPWADQVSLSRKRNEVAIYTDRLAQQFKSGPEYRDEVAFNQMQATLPLTFGHEEYQNRVSISDHPGDWVCEILVGGEKVRTFSWKVGSNGLPVAHPEQEKGNINLSYYGYLVEIDIPAGGTEWDYRLKPMPESGFFYGIPWSTPEGKQMAGSVPQKGNLFHVPSNKAGN